MPTIAVRFLTRRNTAAGWADDPEPLLLGEVGYETDSDQFKVGDGVTEWTSLGYANRGPAGEDGVGVPDGGVTGQVLTRVSDGVAWQDSPGPSGIDGGLDLTLLFNNQLI